MTALALGEAGLWLAEKAASTSPGKKQVEMLERTLASLAGVYEAAVGGTLLKLGEAHLDKNSGRTTFRTDKFSLFLRGHHLRTLQRRAVGDMRLSAGEASEALGLLRGAAAHG